MYRLLRIMNYRYQFQEQRQQMKREFLYHLGIHLQTKQIIQTIEKPLKKVDTNLIGVIKIKDLRN